MVERKIGGRKISKWNQDNNEKSKNDETQKIKDIFDYF